MDTNEYFLKRSDIILMENGIKNIDYAKTVSKCLYAYYSENDRKFFNVSHVYYMLKRAEEYFPGQSKPTSLEPSEQLAILFHDIIRIPHQIENDEKSIDLMLSMMNGFGVVIDEYSWCSRIIRATFNCTHYIYDESVYSVLDLDRIWLSTPYEIFENLANSLKHDLLMDDNEFKSYLTVLKKKKIYHRLEHIEEWAKSNIDRYIK